MKIISYILILIVFVISYITAHLFGSHLLDGIAFGCLITLIIGLICTKSKKETVTQRYENELSEQLKNTASYSAHLSNVISGINHEVQPWIGGIQNIVTRTEQQLNNNIRIDDKKLKKKLNNIKYSCEQTRNLLQLLSTNVKKLNQYNKEPFHLLDTLESWVSITLMDRFIKDLVDENNFIIEADKLDWTTPHSPMLLAQVILNLVKNSIEHNPDMLDSLQITFTGDPDSSKLIYKDNGKGIPLNMITSVFQVGITTKQQNKNQHGFGLALCSEYCLSMGAILEAVGSDDGACFIITFDQSNSTNYQEKVEQSGQGSGFRPVIYETKRTIKPAIKGDSTYEKFGEMSDLSERSEPI